MRDPFYEMVYHRKDYSLADALRPQPGWGRRRFTVSASIMDQHGGELDTVLAAADPADTPDGYRLTSVTLYPVDGPERVIWSTAPDHRRVQTPLPQKATP